MKKNFEWAKFWTIFITIFYQWNQKKIFQFSFISRTFSEFNLANFHTFSNKFWTKFIMIILKIHFLFSNWKIFVFYLDQKFFLHSSIKIVGLDKIFEQLCKFVCLLKKFLQFIFLSFIDWKNSLAKIFLHFFFLSKIFQIEQNFKEIGMFLGQYSSQDFWNFDFFLYEFKNISGQI